MNVAVNEEGNRIFDSNDYEEIPETNRRVWVCCTCQREAIEPKDYFMVVTYDENKCIKEITDFDRFKDAKLYSRKHGGFVVEPLYFYEKAKKEAKKPLTDQDLEEMKQLEKLLADKAKKEGWDDFQIIFNDPFDNDPEFLSQYEEIVYGDYYKSKKNAVNQQRVRDGY